MYRDTANVEHEMCGHTGNKGSQRNSTKGFKEKFGSDNRKTFDRFFTTKDSCTWNITRNTESTAMWSLKPERWGSPLVQGKYREEKACDRRHPYRVIIIIIIIPGLVHLHDSSVCSLIYSRCFCRSRFIHTTFGMFLSFITNKFSVHLHLQYNIISCQFYTFMYSHVYLFIYLFLYSFYLPLILMMRLTSEI